MRQDHYTWYATCPICHKKTLYLSKTDPSNWVCSGCCDVIPPGHDLRRIVNIVSLTYVQKQRMLRDDFNPDWYYKK